MPVLVLPGALAALLVTSASGIAQQATNGKTPDGDTSALHLKSVTMPEPVPVDAAQPQAEGAVGTGPGDRDAGLAQTPAARGLRALRIAIVPRGEPAALLRALDPLRQKIAHALSRPVEILAVADFTAMIDAQALHRIDLGFYSASAYVLADKLCECLDPLVAPAAADGSMAFHGIIVARRGSAIASIDDLEGREIAAGAPDSVGNRRIQLAELAAGGIDVGSFFSGIIAARSALQAVLMVRDGRADAAFTWSSLTGDADAGYSRGPLADLVSRGEISMTEIAIIWRSQPIAHAPVAVARSIPAEIRRALTDLFVRLANDDPETYDLLDRDYGGGYRPVRRQDYAGAFLLAEQDAAIGDVQAEVLMPRDRARTAGSETAGIEGQGAD